MIAAIFLIATMPTYLETLPWTCEGSVGSSMNGMRFDHLTRCVPKGTPKITAFVQQAADAMGNAGHPPRLRFGGHGPFLYAFDGDTIISLAFVRGPKSFDVWVSRASLGAPVEALPVLPAGAEVVAQHHEDSGKRLLSLRLIAPSREAGALVRSTLDALGAQAMSSMPTHGGRDGISGRLLWAGKPGFYHVTDGENGDSYLTLYTGGDRS